MSWTDDRIALLKKMWKDGKSAADIAKTLGKGVTRNAVIGKAHRMGLSNRPSPIKKPESALPKETPKKKEPAKKEVAKKEAKPAAASPKKAAAPVVVSGVKNNPLVRGGELAEPRKMEKEAIPPGGGVALIDLTERMCKWPIGDPREDDFTFCGRGIRAGTPYCHDHASMAYQTSSRSRNQQAVIAEEKEVKDTGVVADDDDDEVVAVT